MLQLTARYADLWNIGSMGRPETMAEPLAKIEAACREVGRDPAAIGITVLIGLWFPDLQANKPSFFDKPLTGTVREMAAAMRGYAELGVQHIMFQCEPYTAEARQPVRRRAVAVDGKTLRGARAPTPGDDRPVHLLAAMDHQSRAVLAQRQVGGAPEEVPAFAPLLEPLDLAGVVVIACLWPTAPATAATAESSCAPSRWPG